MSENKKYTIPYLGKGIATAAIWISVAFMSQFVSDDAISGIASGATVATILLWLF